MDYKRPEGEGEGKGVWEGWLGGGGGETFLAAKEKPTSL